MLRVIVCFDMQALEDVTQVLNDCGISSITRKRGVCSYFVLTLIDSLISAVSKGHGCDALARITAITKAAALRPHATPAESPSSGGGSGAGKGCASNTLEAAWSADEDAILLDQVAKEFLKFNLIANSCLRGKTAKQCKDRCVGLSALLISPLISHSPLYEPTLNPLLTFLTPFGFLPLLLAPRRFELLASTAAAAPPAVARSPVGFKIT